MATTKKTSKRNKTPDGYRAPLRSREAIINFLLAHTSHYGDHSNYPLAFNVKAYGVDFDFEHMLEVHKKSGYGEHLEDAAYVERLRAHFEETVSEGQLWEYGVEGAQRNILEYNHKTKRNEVTDCYKELWDGTDVGNVELEFFGRSCGWLGIAEIAGGTLRCMGAEDFAAWLEELPYADLRNVYRYAVMLGHDTRREAVIEAIESAAAFDYFENLARDVETPAAHRMTELAAFGDVPGSEKLRTPWAAARR